MLHPCAQQQLQDLPKSLGGDKVMGSVAQGEFEAQQEPLQKKLQHAVERLAKARRIAELLSDHIACCSDPANLHVAWALATTYLEEALLYDVRTCPSAVMQPLLGQQGALLR